MPYARNALDGTRVYFEDDGGDGVPVVFHGGIVDSVPLLRDSACLASRSLLFWGISPSATFNMTSEQPVH
jgi:hypothetical protein